jgi:hypothetical protein
VRVADPVQEGCQQGGNFIEKGRFGCGAAGRLNGVGTAAAPITRRSADYLIPHEPHHGRLADRGCCQPRLPVDQLLERGVHEGPHPSGGDAAFHVEGEVDAASAACSGQAPTPVSQVAPPPEVGGVPHRFPGQDRLAGRTLV